MNKKIGKNGPATVDQLFVFGLDEKGKPRGARFAETNDRLVSVALDMMLTAVITPSAAFAQVAMTLPAGRLYASGKAFVPNIKRSLYDDIVAVMSEQGDTSQALKLDRSQGQTANDPASSVDCISPMTSGLPRSWDSIDVGCMVIAHESHEAGWFESVVEKRENDILTLRFRDYPEQPRFQRHVLTVALVNPGPAQNGQS